MGTGRKTKKTFVRKRTSAVSTPVSKPKRPFNADAMCGAQLRKKERGRLCQQPKGYKTPHPGEGRCWLHGGLTPIKHGLDSLIKHGRLRDLITKVKQLDHAVLDLEPEALLMRAMMIDFVNRYEDFCEALLAWYERLDEERAENDLPPIPRKYPELEDAAKLIEATSRIVERMHKIQREGSITLDVFRGVMTQLGLVVAKNVEDPNILRRIEDEWSAIMVNPRSFVRETAGVAPVSEDDE